MKSCFSCSNASTQCAPKATGHDRVGLKMTLEKPQIRPDIQFRQDFSLAVVSAAVADLDDPVEHQKGRQGQLRVALAEQLALGASQEIVVRKAAFPAQTRRPNVRTGPPPSDPSETTDHGGRRFAASSA